MKFYSQHGQDKYFFENFFKDKKSEGFFLDIGAHDGLDINNTVFFERELGWKGICIEPMKNRFDSLVKNRNCICINGCVSNIEGEEDFIIFPEYTDMLSGLAKTFDEKIKNLVDSKIKEQNNDSSKTIKVKSFILNNILEEYKINHIDFVSLDTEGAELSILETIDFEKINIDFFTIENNNYDNKIKKFMKSKGYKLIEVLNCDELYKKIK
jgi:FkbM family methyltransferase